ncbi:MAG: helix-turn-helix domain-containing protein [Candidatus Saccharicenans sp.]|uniref:helix-turn-helix domain-containing protein n=1 Tax=Candidatus Saccharicenans sp. TaxID=2819258 RepID=UPI00404B9A7A
MESIGKELQKEREARGLSLKDISLQTKIGLRHLEAIENDRLDLLPGGFFTRHILKAYISAIGLKPEDWLSRYDHPGLKPPSQEQLGSKKGSQSQKEPAADSVKYYLASKEKKAEAELEEKKKELRLDKIVWITLSVIVLCLFVFLIYLSIQTTRKNVEARKAREKVQAEVTIPAEEPLTPAETTVAETVAQPQPVQGLQLELSFDEDCWIQVFADGNLIVDGLKLEGFRIQVRAEAELIINLGNAGGVSFRLNGQPGKSLGKKGAVVKNIKITRDNWTEFVDQGQAPE